MAIKIPQLERITHALGYICVFWAWLEDSIGEIIDDLTPLDGLKVTDDQRKKIGRLISADQDIRGKIKLLRAIALVRSWDEAWFKKMDDHLNYIDNNLRPKRNRFIHDQWHRPGGKLTQLSRAAKIKRPKSFAALELSLETRTPVKMKEVWALAHAILKAQIKLIQLYFEFETVQKYIDREVQNMITKQIVETLLTQTELSSSPKPPAKPSASPRRSPRSKQRRQKTKRPVP